MGHAAIAFATGAAGGSRPCGWCSWRRRRRPCCAWSASASRRSSQPISSPRLSPRDQIARAATCLCSRATQDSGGVLEPGTSNIHHDVRLVFLSVRVPHCRIVSLDAMQNHRDVVIIFTWYFGFWAILIHFSPSSRRVARHVLQEKPACRVLSSSPESAESEPNLFLPQEKALNMEPQKRLCNSIY